LEAADEILTAGVQRAVLARNATPYATDCYSQAMIKSLQFESVSMKIARNEKKDAAVRFFGQIVSFRRQHASEFIAQWRREPDNVFRSEKIHIQDDPPLLRDLGSRLGSGTIATGVERATEHGGRTSSIDA
jgi:hypothetical protein